MRSITEFRRAVRIKQNVKELNKEKRYYQQIFAERCLSIPDEAETGTLLRRRYPCISPKKKGRLRLLAIYHHYNWENFSLKPALEKFGEVVHYDWGERFDRHSKGWWGVEREELNADLVRQVEAWHRKAPFDFIFAYLSGWQVKPTTISAMKRLGVPMVNLSLNDKEHFIQKVRGGQAAGIRDICRYFDLSWTSANDALKKYCVEGAIPFYLPEGANPEVHKPDWELFNDPSKRDIAVSFVGQCYGERLGIISRLKDGGVNVIAFGTGWDGGELSVTEMVQMYSRSHISLGFGGVIGYDGTNTLKGRDFEVPMSGGFYLTQHHQELEQVYDIGKEIVTYDCYDELVGKIRYYLSHPNEAQAIRVAGYKRAQSEHSWEGRFEKILRLFGLIA